jgi:hypothetical protein
MTKEGSLGARACYNGSRAPVAQLDRASGYEPEGRVFESLRAHHRIQSNLLSQFTRFEASEGATWEATGFRIASILSASCC